jgi:hypothetical protein
MPPGGRPPLEHKSSVYVKVERLQVCRDLNIPPSTTAIDQINEAHTSLPHTSGRDCPSGQSAGGGVEPAYLNDAAVASHSTVPDDFEISQKMEIPIPSQPSHRLHHYK